MNTNPLHRRRGRVAALAVSFSVLLLLGVPSVEAIRIGGADVVVPVIAHNPGLLGSEWRTDVWIYNPYGDAGEVTLTFYPEGGGSATSVAPIEPYRGLFFQDIVLTTFGMDNAKGLLIVSAADIDVEARARIYNTGSSVGQYGQAVPGLAAEQLRRQSDVGGVSTTEGNRVSVGVANPTALTFDVGIVVRDATTGSILHSQSLTLSPHQLVQFSDVATAWALPASPDLRVEVGSGGENERFVYAYASVVRNDSGDAIFIFGTSPNT